MNRTMNIWILSFLFLAVAAMGLSGCSEKVVNNRDVEQNLMIDIQKAPAEVEVAVEIYRLTVTGEDMDPVVADLRLVDNHYVVGQLEVPAGDRRLFVLEGLYGDPEGGDLRVIYRGQTTASVQPGVATTLSISLAVVAPMIKLSPTHTTLMGDDLLVLDLRVYNIPQLTWLSTSIRWDYQQFGDDPPVIFTDWSGDWVEADYVTEGSFLNMAVQDTSGVMLTNAGGDGVIARIILRPIIPVGLGSVSATIDFESLSMSTKDGQKLTASDVFTSTAYASLVAVEDRVVYFPDVELDRAVRSLSSVGTGEDIMLSDIYDYQYFSITEIGVSDLTGMENMFNLTDLGISYNLGITDLSPIAGLTKLTWLDADSVGTGDLSDLADLIWLRSLQFARNNATSISTLAGFTTLRELDLSYNQITDLTPLRNLTSLDYLYLHNNSIADISPLLDNPGLGEGDYITLYGNVALENNETQLGYVAQLEDRGVYVDMLGPSIGK